ncbi:hypothetical protein ELE36_01160 [Pseudolysobacter antarcticus]|uniref:DUF2946 domain-containing protein n=1 Tax=Pseudolysobacter antarcticus TaxID=2511995 RepID=A0A411HF51_9GAMM|nr:hypothetical protein [Pseudolysobacter antarcticus]QBB69101.1 hypothetical protein ELE36_01160 [Pseudolysobacter antarcticus]
MPARSLMTRLRRHVAMSAWLFALLVLAQTAFATVCLTDAAPPSSTLATATAEQAVTLIVAAQNPSADEAENCWHAGSGGCHCACVHSVSLTSSAWHIEIKPPVSTRFDFSPAAPIVAVHDDHLRPPIA